MIKKHKLPDNINQLIDVLTFVKETFIKPRETDNHSSLLNLDSTLRYLSQSCYQISKSSIYKLTSSNLIPFKRLSRKLIFDKEQLNQWCLEKTSEIESKNVFTYSLSQIANKRIHNGKH